MLEIADAEATAARDRRLFLRLAAAPARRPLAQRVRPELRDELAGLVAAADADSAALAGFDDWAAALTLARALEARHGLAAEHGVEQVLLERADGRPVIGLETLAGQLGLFDRLDARTQRALLEAVVADGADPELGPRLVEAWALGDVAALDRYARSGMLADPALRDALLVARNRAWAAQVEAMLRAGRRPFVAVGAAHLAGAEGLPAALEQRGWQVRRVQ